MPFTLMIAIFVAFGLDLGEGGGPIGPEALRWRILATLGVVGIVGVYAVGLAGWIARRADVDGGPTSTLRRHFGTGCRLLDMLSLGGYAWIIHGFGWPDAIRRGFGLGGTLIADEALILLPYLLMQSLGWMALYRAEHALRSRALKSGRLGYVVLRARQSMGLVLPIALAFSLGQDLLARRWPDAAGSPWIQIVWMAAMGTSVLILAPAFVRLTWPTRSLPAGPLRDRLERLSGRLGFRCTDILIWDTGGGLVNAGVTGAMPWYRYVLLTDALVEHLDAHQVEAVFGHEVGHIAHRHLHYFGLFFVGSIGLMALVGEGIDRFLSWADAAMAWPWTTYLGNPTLVLLVQWTAFLGCLGLHFLLVFGFLSRRFERQADVYGCRAVSCGRPDCPPHADLNARPVLAPSATDLCPAGIRIFASALAEVAALNGMNRESRWAWRHGSIARRIAFLEALEGRPDAERHFQATVRRLRVVLALALAGLIVAAWSTGALSNLR